MDTLADELLKMILGPPLLVPDDLFADGSDLSPFRKTTTSASDVLLVCKRFMRVATPTLYETVIIRTVAQAAALKAALTRNPEFGLFVRKFRLEAAYELAAVIPTMPHVSDFCFTPDIRGNESMATMEAAFATFQITRVVLTLPQIRRDRYIWWQDDTHITKRHRALAAALCAAIPHWSKLREFSYPKPTRNAPKICGEHDIATALAGSSSVQVVNVWAYSWNVSQMPPILQVLLSGTRIPTIRLHSPSYYLADYSFLHQCQPELRQRLLLVDPAAGTLPAAPSPNSTMLEANPFYHPMQHATYEERVAMWARIISFIIYDDKPTYCPPPPPSWFDRDGVDLAGSRALILVSRDVSAGLIAVLSRDVCFGTEAARRTWIKYLMACPALGSHVRSLESNAEILGDAESDAIFRRMPHIRFLWLGMLTPAFIRAFEGITPIIGLSLRTLILSCPR